MQTMPLPRYVSYTLFLEPIIIRTPYLMFIYYLFALILNVWKVFESSDRVEPSLSQTGLPVSNEVQLLMLIGLLQSHPTRLSDP